MKAPFATHRSKILTLGLLSVLALIVRPTIGYAETQDRPPPLWENEYVGLSVLSPSPAGAAFFLWNPKTNEISHQTQWNETLKQIRGVGIVDAQNGCIYFHANSDIHGYFLKYDPFRESVVSRKLEYPFSLQRFLLKDGTSVLESRKANSGGIILSTISKSLQTSKPLDTIIADSSTLNEDLLASEKNEFWISGVARQRAQVFQVQPELGNVKTIYTSAPGVTTLLLSRSQKLTFISEYSLGDLSKEKPAESNRLIILDDQGHLVSSVNRTWNSHAFLSRGFFVRNRILFLSTEIKNERVLNQIWEFNSHNKTLIPIGTEFDFWFMRDPVVKDDKVYLFNDSKRRIIDGIEFDIEQKKPLRRFHFELTESGKVQFKKDGN